MKTLMTFLSTKKMSLKNLLAQGNQWEHGTTLGQIAEKGKMG